MYNSRLFFFTFLWLVVISSDGLFAAKADSTEPESIELHIQYTDNQVMLSWDQKSEMNSGLIVIERSLDGTHFGRLAEIVMEGQLRGQRSRTNNYLDTNLSDLGSPRIFYRIRHIDTEGQIIRSATKYALLVDEDESLRILGNPGHTDSHLRVQLLGSESTRFHIRSAAGKEVFKYDLKSHSEEMMVYVKNWESGIYYASLSDGEQFASYKFEVK